MKTRRKLLIGLAGSILGLVIAGSIIAQVVQGGGTVEFQSQTTSGLSGTLTFPDQLGTQTGSWEMIVNGAPATNSVTISGCMPSGTCTVLQTTTSITNVIVSTAGGPYSSYQVAWTLTGGTSPTLQFNRRATVAKSFAGSVVGAVAGIVNKIFGVAWVEVSVQPGADIDAQFVNACAALSSLSAGGGILSATWNGTLTGSSAPAGGVLATCPVNTMLLFLGGGSQAFAIDEPIVLPKQSRIYGSLGRSGQTIKAAAAFKTNIANKRNASLAQTTGLSRSAGGVVTATFTNTAGAFGQAAVAQEPVTVGCASATDAAFVGTYLVQSANATTITYNQPQLGAQTNTGGTCTLIAGTPLVDFGPGTYGVTTSASFGIGISGMLLDCDDLAPATGCEGIRNIYSQEKTFIDDVSIINFNFIALVLDNMQSSGLQNSGPYRNLELYANPQNDTHGNNCNPTSTPGPFPLVGIFAYGLSVRSISAFTITTTNCSTTTPVANNNLAIESISISNSGNVQMDGLGVGHCEGFNVCVEVGDQQAMVGGLTIINFGGQPNDARTFLGTSTVIDISNNYASTDVTMTNIRRNTGPTNTIVNNIDGDTLNCGGDTTVALYAWDKAGAVGNTVSTTSQCVPNRMVGLAVNRLITQGGQPPTLASTGLGTGTITAISGNSDSGGTIQLSPAGAPAASGVVTITFTSALGGHIPHCVAMYSNQASGTWLTTTQIFASGGDTTGAAHIGWNTGGAALTAGSNYNINYFCQGNS